MCVCQSVHISVHMGARHPESRQSVRFHCFGGPGSCELHSWGLEIKYESSVRALYTLNCEDWAVFPTCVSSILPLHSIFFAVHKLHLSTCGLVFWLTGVLLRMFLHVSIVAVVFLPFPRSFWVLGLIVSYLLTAYFL